MDPYVLIEIQPSEATPETLEPHPHPTTEERSKAVTIIARAWRSYTSWKKNRQLSIPPVLEENAMASRPGALELVKINIRQENHAGMDTSKAGTSFGGERSSPKRKVKAEIVPALESRDPSEAKPSSSEPRSRSKLKEPEETGSTSGVFYKPVSSDTDNIFEQQIEFYQLVVKGDVKSFDQPKGPIMLPQLSPQGNSPLHVAAQYKQAAIAEAIIQREPELVNCDNMNGDLPLHIAARVGCVDTSRVLIEQTELNVEITNDQGDTALHDAVRGAHLEVVKLLVQEKPHWTSTENKVGESPLFLAVDKWHFDIANEIFSKDECSIRGRDSMNVLHAAIIRLGPGKLLPNTLTILLD